MLVVADPPLPAIAPARQARVTGVGKECGLTTVADAGDGSGRHDLFAADAALVQHQLAQTRQVTQADVETTAGKRRADGVSGEEGFALGADAAPNALGEELGHRLTAAARDQPAQGVGIDGLVSEGLAMGAAFLHRLQILEIAARAGVVLGLGQGAAGHGVGAQVGIFRVGQRGGHVHDLPHRRIAKGAVLQLGDDAANECGIIQLAFGHQHLAKQAGDGFGHRHHRMQAVRLQAAVVALIHHSAMVKHEDAVGVVGGKGLVPGHRRIRTERGETDAVQPRVERKRQWACARAALAHAHVGHELAKVAHRPAQLGKGEEVGVGEADGLVGGRWKALHPAHCLGIGILRRQRRRRLRQGAGRYGEGHGQGQRRCEHGFHKVVLSPVPPCSQNGCMRLAAQLSSNLSSSIFSPRTFSNMSSR